MKPTASGFLAEEWDDIFWTAREGGTSIRLDIYTLVRKVGAQSENQL